MKTCSLAWLVVLLGLVSLTKTQRMVAATADPGLPAEFTALADVDGDGNPDLILVDRESGAVRVGHRSAASGEWRWDRVLASGLEDVTGVAAGRFEVVDRDSLLLASPSWNLGLRITLDPAAADGIRRLERRVDGVGPAHAAVGAPFAPEGMLQREVMVSVRNATPSTDHLHVPASGAIGAGNWDLNGQVLDLVGLQSGSPAQHRSALLIQRAGSWLLELRDLRAPTRISSTILGSDDATHGRLIAIPRGAGDFDLLSFTRGSSGLHWVRVEPGADGVDRWGAVQTASAGAGIDAVCWVESGPTWSIAIVESGSAAVRMLRWSGGVLSPAPGPVFSLPAGHRALNLVRSGENEFLLLSGDGAQGWATRAVSYRRAGETWTQGASVALPSVHAHSGDANLLLFAANPWTNPNLAPLERRRVGDWTRAFASGPAAGQVQVTAESDRGNAPGLGESRVRTLSTAPSVTAGIVNQHRPHVSLWHLGLPTVNVLPELRATPPAGRYADPVSVTLAPASVAGEPGTIVYRTGRGPWLEFAGALGPFTTTTTLEFCWRRTHDGALGAIGESRYELAPTPNLSDCDHDGVPDFVERVHGLPACGGADADGDGATDLAELLSGSLPGDAGSLPIGRIVPRVTGRVRVALRPQSSAGAVTPTPLVFSLDARAGQPATTVALQDLFGRFPTTAEPLVPPVEVVGAVATFVPAPRAAPTQVLPGSGVVDPAAWFEIAVQAPPGGLWVAASSDLFDLQTSPLSLGAARGREIVGFVDPADWPVERFNFQPGPLSDAEEAERWVREARVFHQASRAPAPVTPLDFRTTLELLLTERLLGRWLFVGHGIGVPRVTLTPQRESERLISQTATGDSDGFVPFTEELNARLEDGADAAVPRLRLLDLRAQTREFLGRVDSPHGGALMALAGEVYRVGAAFVPENRGSLAKPLDVLRRLLHGSAEHSDVRAYLQSPAWGLTAPALAAAQGAVDALLAEPAPAQERTWFARLDSTWQGVRCVALVDEASGGGLALASRYGGPYQIPTGLDLVPGSRLRVTGRPGISRECPGTAIEVTRIEVLGVPRDPVVDQNGNGVPDAWERYQFGDLVDASADHDGDGVTDLEEYQRGTDPRENAALVEGERLSGLVTQPLGRARLARTDQGVQFKSLTASGEDGAVVLAPGASALRVDFAADNVGQNAVTAEAGTRYSLRAVDAAGNRLAELTAVWNASGFGGFDVQVEFSSTDGLPFRFQPRTDFRGMTDGFEAQRRWRFRWDFLPKAVEARLQADGSLRFIVHSPNERRGARVRMYAGESLERLVYPEAVELESLPGLFPPDTRLGGMELRFMASAVAGLQSRTLTSATVVAGEFPGRALGLARLQVQERGLRVLPVPGARNFAFQMATGSFSRFEASLELPANVSAGTQLRVDVLGPRTLATTREPDFRFASLRWEHEGVRWLVTPDVSPLQVPSLQVEVFDVGGEPMPWPTDSLSVHVVEALAAGVRLSDTDALRTPQLQAQIEADGALSWELRWPTAVPAQFADGTALNIGRVRWTSLGGTSPLEWTPDGSPLAFVPGVLAPGRLRTVEFRGDGLSSLTVAAARFDATNPIAPLRVGGWVYEPIGNAVLSRDVAGRLYLANLTDSYADGFRVRLQGVERFTANFAPASHSASSIAFALFDTSGAMLGDWNSRLSDLTWDAAPPTYVSDWNSLSLMGTTEFDLVARENAGRVRAWRMSAAPRNQSYFNLRHTPTAWSAAIRADGGIDLSLETRNLANLDGPEPATYLTGASPAATINGLPYQVDLSSPPNNMHRGARLGSAVFRFAPQEPFALDGPRFIAPAGGAILGTGAGQPDSIPGGVRVGGLGPNLAGGVIWQLGNDRRAYARVRLAPTLVAGEKPAILARMLGSNSSNGTGSVLAGLRFDSLPGGDGYQLAPVSVSSPGVTTSFRSFLGPVSVIEFSRAPSSVILRPGPIAPKATTGGREGARPSGPEDSPTAVLNFSFAGEILANGATAATASWLKPVDVEFPDGTHHTIDQLTWIAQGGPPQGAVPWTIAVAAEDVEQFELTDLETAVFSPFQHRLGGRLVDGSGRPIAGSRIALVGALQRETTSHADGSFDFGDLPVVGVLQLTAGGGDSGYLPATHEVALLSTVTDVVLTLQSAVVIAPTLRVRLENGSIVVEWDNSQSGFQLESRVRLGGAEPWSPVPSANTPGLVRIPAIDGERYFRLFR